MTALSVRQEGAHRTPLTVELGMASSGAPCGRALTSCLPIERARARDNNLHKFEAVSALFSPVRREWILDNFHTNFWAAWFQDPVVSATNAV